MNDFNLQENLRRNSNEAPTKVGSILSQAVMVILLTALVGGCSDNSSQQAAPNAPSHSSSEAPPVDVPMATTNTLANLPAEELAKRANQALNSQRMHSPAGDNAIEYYLALRDKTGPNKAQAENALVEIMPYALIGAEQAIQRNDIPDAQRILALIELADPQAPALPRIREAITTAGQKTAELAIQEEEKARLEEERRLREEKLAEERKKREQELAQQREQQGSEPVAAVEQPKPVKPSPQPARPQSPQPDTTPPTASTPPATSAPATTKRGPPRPISRPQPPYPRSAVRNRIEGFVEVEYTVNADGSVGNVKVIRGQPRGLFDKTVADTLQQWRFEPPGEATVLRRTIKFQL